MTQSIHSNYNVKSLQKQNFVASKTLSQTFSKASSKNSKFEEKSDSQWKMKLERILNKKSKQKDYFGIVSSFDSNESRDIDSCGSDTDVTRPDDIVIQLDESSFYNAKVNPFPLLKFPPINKSQSINTLKVAVVEDNQDSPTDTKTVEGNPVAEENPPVVDNPPEIETTEEEEVVEDNPPEVITSNDADDNQLEPENSPTVDNPPVDAIKDVVEHIPENSSAITTTNEEEVVEEQLPENSPVTATNTDEVRDQLTENASAVTLTNDEDQVKDQLPEDPLAITPANDEEVIEEQLPENTSAVTVTNDEEEVKEQLSENSSDVTMTKDEKTVKDKQPDSAVSAPDKDVIDSKEPKKRRKRKIKRKNVDYNHQTNMKLWEDDSSESTKITSKTTIEIRTNDDSVFDTLEDLPDFINSSITELTSSYIEQKMRLDKKGNRWSISLNSTSSSTSSDEDMQSMTSYENYISTHEAYRRINKLLEQGTKENLYAFVHDDYHNIRLDDDIASSEEEFLSDLDDLDLTGWIPRESELRKQVRIILTKLNPLEYNYKSTVDDILRKYLKYIKSKGRTDKIEGIVECVEKAIPQKGKTELLIKREIEDKKLHHEFYYSPLEPPDFTELCARRRDAIYRKYSRCEMDRDFCHRYFKKSLQLNRPISNLEQKIEELKRQMDLIFA